MCSSAHGICKSLVKRATSFVRRAESKFFASDIAKSLELKCVCALEKYVSSITTLEGAKDQVELAMNGEVAEKRLPQITILKVYSNASHVCINTCTAYSLERPGVH
jgi:hypothetical protein